MGKIAKALGADDVRRPFLRHEPVELVQVERLAAIVDKRTHAVLIGLSFLLILNAFSFESIDPCSRSGDLLEVEHPGIQDILQGHVAEVALDDLYSGV